MKYSSSIARSLFFQFIVQSGLLANITGEKSFLWKKFNIDEKIQFSKFNLRNFKISFPIQKNSILSIGGFWQLLYYKVFQLSSKGIAISSGQTSNKRRERSCRTNIQESCSSLRDSHRQYVFLPSAQRQSGYVWAFVYTWLPAAVPKSK